MQKMKTAWISIQLDRQLKHLKGRALGEGGADGEAKKGLLGTKLENEHTGLVDEIDDQIKVRTSEKEGTRGPLKG